MAIRERESLSSPEGDFEVLRNETSETIPVGGAVCFDLVVADGVAVAKPTTATLSAFAGIADEEVAPGDYFRVQRGGWRSTGALVRNDAVTNIEAGDILVPVNGQWYLQRSGASDGKSGFVVAGEFYAAGTLATELKKVVIKAR